MRVLIVEDDDAVRGLFAEILARADYEVTSTESIFGAAALVRELQPSAVLLDIGLPFRPGTALLEELKSDPTTAEVPVVLVSGMPESLSEERRAQATAVLVKPVEPQRLLDVLREVCARRQGSSSL